jgi:hypothetical protein
MNSRRALFIAACLFPVAAGLFAGRFAAAQAPPTQPPAVSPWDQMPQQSQWPQETQNNCIQEFTRLRDNAQKRAAAIRTAGARKAPAKEACALFNVFSDAEVKMIKFAIDNGTRCSIPPEIIKTLKQGNARTAEMRTRVCQAANAPERSAGPSLSDALSSPVPDANNIKSGRGNGTFDTLTGTPLGSK